MKYIICIYILLFFVSCAYPDIDSVPKFDEMIFTKEEAIDLCNLSSTDKNQLSECLKKVNKDYTKKK
tara:strand:+ start:16561 stop:16761 length:201 start_codon:yes stop_codon:yes gene_type:complete